MPDAPLNIAAYLPLMAQRLPDKRAIVCPCGRDTAGHVRYSHLTFLQLDQETDRLAAYHTMCVDFVMQSNRA